MSTPLSPNWPAWLVAVIQLFAAPFQSLFLPKIPQQWRVVTCGVIAFAITALAVQFTALEPSELMMQAGVIYAMILSGYVVARNNQAAIAGLATAAVGAGAVSAAAFILPAFAQDSALATGAADAAKEAAKAQLSWWLLWAVGIIGGRLGRWIDGSHARPRAFGQARVSA